MTISQRIRNHVLVLAAAAALSSCGSSATSICADLCDCSGCSDEQQDECVDTIEDAIDVAEDEGCGDQVDDLLDCYGSELECRDGQVDLDGCQSEAEAVNKCIGGDVVSSGSGNPGSGGSSPDSGGSGGAPSSSSSGGGSAGGTPGGPSSSSSTGGTAGGPPGAASSSSGGDF